MREDTHVTDRNGRLLETIWHLNEQFQNEDADEDYLDMQFRAVDHYKQEIREEERLRISNWLRSLDKEGGEINRFLPTTLANWIDERMYEL